jgi:hypothetical protein
LESKLQISVQFLYIFDFDRSYSFEVTIPQQSLLRVQLWDWDLASINDKIAETSIDIENRWFSCHRATCGLPSRYDRLIKYLLREPFRHFGRAETFEIFEEDRFRRVEQNLS